MSQAMSIVLDGMTYRVGIEYESMKRSGTLFEGNNTGVAIAGNDIRDVIGTKYKYEMTVYALPGYQEDYDEFYYAITAPVDTHRVELPFGQRILEFDAKIESASDNYYGIENGVGIWDKMSVEFIPIKPQRSA